MQGLVRWMVGATCVLAVTLAHAAPPRVAHHGAHVAAARWGLRASADSLYTAGGYHWINGAGHGMPRGPVFSSEPPRGGSIRDAVTRYSEERGSNFNPPRAMPGDRMPPPIIPPAQRRN